MANIRLEDIDRNFVASVPENTLFKFYDITQSPFAVYGFSSCKQGEFYRMPIEIAETVSVGVHNLCRNTSGGRIRFKTDSAHIVVKSVLPQLNVMKHMPFTGSSFFDLYIDGKFRKPFYPANDFHDTANVEREALDGFISHIDLKTKQMREIEINFPLYNAVSEVHIGLEEDAAVLKGREYIGDKPIVYYGSSITQGGCASHPGNAYQNIISRRLNRDFVNLGFSGACKAELEMANYLATLDMSAFVYDYDHNAPNADYLNETHERLFNIIRQAHPEIPVIMISAADISFRNDIDARKKVIFKTYNNALTKGDKNVYFIDGSDIYKDVGVDYCTVDGCHPNDLGFWCMANSIGKVLEKVL